MRLLVEATTDEDVRFGLHGRVSRVEFAGLAFWLRPSTADPEKEEICVIEMRARLTEGNEVEVRSVKSGCELQHPIPV